MSAANAAGHGVRTADVRLRLGDRVQFDSKRTSWLCRAVTKDGRYTLLTSAMFGDVYYTIIDHERRIRGPMDIIGWGLGIFTLRGPDPAIDEAIRKLEEDHFEVSRRGQVPLVITALREPDDTDQHAARERAFTKEGTP